MIIDLNRLVSPEVYKILQAKAARLNLSMEALIAKIINEYDAQLKLEKRNDNRSESAKLASYCKTWLHLETAVVSDYYYPHFALGVIGAIFSINAKWTAAENVVKRFCDAFGVDQRNRGEKEFGVNDLLAVYDKHSIEFMADHIYRNHQRTSPTNGILKADAVLRVARVMADYNIDNADDLLKVKEDLSFEAAFKAVPGQTYGTALKFMYMMAGAEDHVKPDRMILRFIEKALTRPIKIEECRALIQETCSILDSEFPGIQPRTLDYIIWKYESESVKSNRSG